MTPERLEEIRKTYYDPLDPNSEWRISVGQHINNAEELLDEVDGLRDIMEQQQLILDYEPNEITQKCRDAEEDSSKMRVENIKLIEALKEMRQCPLQPLQSTLPCPSDTFVISDLKLNPKAAECQEMKFILCKRCQDLVLLKEVDDLRKITNRLVAAARPFVDDKNQIRDNPAVWHVSVLLKERDALREAIKGEK